jgi:hypothetical protein
MTYIEIDGHRLTVAEWINNGLAHATPAATEAESRLARMLYDELSNQWAGRGLTHGGGGLSETGKQIVVVAGSIDLVALARRVLATYAR